MAQASRFGGDRGSVRPRQARPELSLESINRGLCMLPCRRTAPQSSGSPERESAGDVWKVPSPLPNSIDWAAAMSGFPSLLKSHTKMLGEDARPTGTLLRVVPVVNVPPPFPNKTVPAELMMSKLPSRLKSPITATALSGIVVSRRSRSGQARRALRSRRAR